jgi:membrane protein implicated in regulation of membrane protease activity
MDYKGRIGGLVLIAGIIALIVWAPAWVLAVLHNVLALSNVALFVFAAGVLAWFLYAVIVRRLLRARRIANARMKRMLQEAGDRDKDQRF